MKEILVFTEIDGDSILELEFDYHFNIGDVVYYELPMEDRKRIALINSLSGFKSLNLIGTINNQGQTNLAIFNSVVHIGANPP